MKNKKLFCFGYGYTCDYLGYALQDIGGWDVAGTTRDPEKKQRMRKLGMQSYLFDYEIPLTDPLHVLQNTTHLLISTPPGDPGDPTYMAHASDIAQIKSLEWIGYLSTTGVYGNRDGGAVTEMSEIRPSSKRGSRRARAEEQWLTFGEKTGLPVHIFRLAGIYGPGRSALDTIRAGVARRIYKEGHAFNRIHVEDIVQILMASLNNPNPQSAYNVSDDEPAPSHDVIGYACELLNVPPPHIVNFEDIDLAPIARSFYNDNKRVINDKIKEEFGIQLKYPTYREGLKACLDAENYILESLAEA